MANTNNPRGLRPIRGASDGPPRLTLYSGGTTTSIGRGDVVAMATNGRIHRIATTAPGPTTTIGVAANYVAAPAAGVTTPTDVWVYDDPNQLFEIQDDGVGATPAQSSIGATYPLVLGTPNTTTGSSIQQLDISAPGTTGTDPLIAVGFIQGIGREIGKNASIIVRLNRHMFKTGSAGI